jgi:hypothetical protein
MLVVAAVLTVSPTARQAVAARLGLRGASIEQVPRLLTPTVGSPGAALNLGEATSLENARTRVPLLLPTLPGLEEPDGIYLATAGGTPRVSLVYAGRGGLPAPTETGVSLLIMESSLPSGFDPIVLRKSAGPATRVEELTINGGRGVWLEGAPHVLFLPDARGQFREDQVRLAANVLLWEQRGLLLRLEGSLPRDQAVQIASSVR